MVLIVLSLAWVAGIWLGSQITPSPAWLLAAALPLVLAGARRRRSRAALACLAVILFTGGAFCYQAASLEVDGNHVSRYIDGKFYTIEGTVSRDPEEKEKSQALRLDGIALGTDGGRIQLAGAVIVYLPPFPEYRYGDRISVTGKLLEPPVFDTFDWRAYLARDEVFATVLYPEVVSVMPGHGNPALSLIYEWRQKLAAGIAAALPEPHASLAQGLALGIRSGISEDIERAFSVSGTAHLLAVSGQNLAIIAGVVLLATRGILGRRGYWYVWLSMAAVWAFAVLTGLAPPVVRAAVMASIFLLAELLGRQKSAAPALCLAAALMTAANPQLLWSASFQMSFGAMAGLIFLLPPFSALARRLADRFPGRKSNLYGIVHVTAQGLAVSAAAMAGVLPLSAYYFGLVALAGGAATLAAAPALPLIIFSSLLAGGAAVIHPAAAVPFAAAAWLALSYLVGTVELFARVPALETGTVSGAVVAGWYLVLGAAALALARWQRRQDEPEPGPPVSFGRLTRFGVPALIIIGALGAALPWNNADSRLEVSFLDVGQGDAIYIRTPAGQDILIDGGPSPQRLVQELGEKMPFWNRTIELVISTHADADHLTGLVEALDRFKVGQIVQTGLGGDTDLYREWQSLMERKGIPAAAAAAGDLIRLAGGLEMEVLNPYDRAAADSNEASLVLRLKYGDISFLLAADIPSGTELELIYRRLLPDATVLKAAHHGSAGSTSAAFLAVTRPEAAVIQVGRNSYGHPAGRVLAALESYCVADGVLRTDEAGTVTFLTDGRTLWLRE